jgi:hypothetical protein
VTAEVDACAFSPIRERKMTKDSIHATLTREDAADRLAELAKQFRHGTVSLNGNELLVSDQVEFKANLDDDELDVKLNWKS